MITMDQLSEYVELRRRAEEWNNKVKEANTELIRIEIKLEKLERAMMKDELWKAIMDRHAI